MPHGNDSCAWGQWAGRHGRVVRRATRGIRARHLGKPIARCGGALRVQAIGRGRWRGTRRHVGGGHRIVGTAIVRLHRAWLPCAWLYGTAGLLDVSATWLRHGDRHRRVRCVISVGICPSDGSRRVGSSRCRPVRSRMSRRVRRSVRHRICCRVRRIGCQRRGSTTRQITQGRRRAATAGAGAAGGATAVSRWWARRTCRRWARVAGRVRGRLHNWRCRYHGGRITAANPIAESLQATPSWLLHHHLRGHYRLVGLHLYR